MGDESRVRLDKWLWAARFFKTRALAAHEVDRGRVSVNGLPAKPARELHVGDEVSWRVAGGPPRCVRILGLSTMRGPAVQAQLLYAETPESIAARENAALQRRLGSEPAVAPGRPTKRDRRHLADWQRWSARVEDLPTDPANSPVPESKKKFP